MTLHLKWPSEVDQIDLTNLTANSIPYVWGSGSFIEFNPWFTFDWSNLLLNASLWSTGTRVTKGWFTDLESTNMPTVWGTSIQDTFVDVAWDTMTWALTLADLANAITSWNYPIQMQSWVSDWASAIWYLLDTANNLSTIGSKVFSFQNNSTNIIMEGGKYTNAHFTFSWYGVRVPWHSAFGEDATVDEFSIAKFAWTSTFTAFGQEWYAMKVEPTVVMNNAFGQVGAMLLKTRVQGSGVWPLPFALRGSLIQDSTAQWGQFAGAVEPTVIASKLQTDASSSNIGYINMFGTEPPQLNGGTVAAVRWLAILPLTALTTESGVVTDAYGIYGYENVSPRKLATNQYWFLFEPQIWTTISRGGWFKWDWLWADLVMWAWWDVSLRYWWTNTELVNLVWSGNFDLQMDLDLTAQNLITDTTTWTKIWTATSQKLWFFNATPIIQPVNTTAIDTLLVNLWLRASGAYANFATTIQPRTWTATANTAPMKFTSGTLLTTPEDWAVEYNDWHWYLTNWARHVITQSSWVKATTTTVTNTVTETTLYSYTFVANELHTDEKVVFDISWVVTNASASDDYTIRFKVGGTTVHTITRVWGNVTDAWWKMIYEGTVRTDWASWTFVDFASHQEWTLTYMEWEATTHSIDTTTTTLFEVTVEWDNAKAGNSISASQGHLVFHH